MTKQEKLEAIQTKIDEAHALILAVKEVAKEPDEPMVSLQLIVGFCVGMKKIVNDIVIIQAMTNPIVSPGSVEIRGEEMIIKAKQQ